MKEEKGDSKLFWAEIFIVIGAFLFSASLINLIKLEIIWLLVGMVFVIIGSAWKSIKKRS